MKQTDYEALAIGSLVRLRSGGPAMTISGQQPQPDVIFTEDRRNAELHIKQVCCQWFDGDTLHDACFSVEALVPFTE